MESYIEVYDDITAKHEDSMWGSYGFHFSLTKY